jgi:hypothetical protein
MSYESSYGTTAKVTRKKESPSTVCLVRIEGPIKPPLTAETVSCRKAYADCTARLALEQKIVYTKNHHFDDFDPAPTYLLR